MSNYPKVEEGIFDTVKSNTEQFLEIVGQYFPEAIKDGEVDFTALKEEMGEFQEVKGEHYDFTWAGKQAAKKEAQADILGRTLRFKPDDSVNADTTENIYIEGDNLEALKLLKKNYYGKIKMIYIDPPYNTGKDFIYRDNFTMSDDELAELSGDAVNGEHLQKNTKDKSRYHTNWLNMMYPRLKIARDLLKDNGLIFISIDYNEQHNIRKLCDIVFNEQNFVTDIIWNSRKSVSNDAVVSLNHNYTLVYTKNMASFYSTKASFKLKDTGEGFENPDNDPRGKWKADPFDSPGIRPNLTYAIKNPNTGTEYWPPEGRCWRTGETEYLQMLQDNRIVFGKTGNSKPQLKRFFSEAQEKGLTPKSLWDDCGTATNGTNEIQALFNAKVFDTPKPTGLINRIIELATSDGDIILDFFSGSATTAHSVFLKNVEDKTNRKFIVIQIAEKCESSSTAYKEGYRNICEIGKERIRRAAKKIHEDNPDAVFDDGFKVFEVADTNIRWNHIDDRDIYDIDYSKGMKDDIDFMPGVNDIDIVYEIMLKQYGIPLSTPIEKLSDISDRTYIFADAVVVCLDADITDELIEKLAAIEPIPAKYILRDSAFDDDIEFKDVSYRRLSALIANHQTDEEKKSKYNNFTVEFI